MVPLLAWNVPLIFPIFLKRSLGFSILLFSSISLHYLRLSLSFLFSGILHSVWYIFPFLSFLLLLFFAQLSIKPPQTTTLHFFGMVLVTASCILLWTSIHSSSGTLTDLIPWIYSSPSLYNQKGFDLGHTWMVFPTFFNLSLNYAIRSSWSEPQSAPDLAFGDYI